MANKIVKSQFNWQTKKDEYFKLSFNQSRRTVTIRKFEGSELRIKMRTYPMERQEFNRAMDFWTYVDWCNFLKTDEYYIVK